MTTRNTNSKREQLWLIGAEGQTRHELIADVALRVKTHRRYQYAVPETLVNLVRPGVLLQAPYGPANRLCEGWCVGLTRGAWDQTHKPVAAVVQSHALLNEQLIELGLWLGEYYACAPGLAIDALVPAVIRKPKYQKNIYLKHTAECPPPNLGKKQLALLDALRDREIPRDVALRQAGVKIGVLRSLRKRGLVELVTRREQVAPEPIPEHANRQPCPPASIEDEYDLTPGQNAALTGIADALAAPACFKVFLLFGVPGSGKTEVYVRAMRHALTAGRQAILLVPEIALATQVVERLARRFERVAVLHSRLKIRDRERTLRAIAAGAVDVVIGTRTAVFAPLPRLGLIVVDEEQESSLKNLAAPFFHARDVAIKRAQIARIPVVLGSATPALETWANANNLPRYKLLRLPERVPGAVLPTVRLVEKPRFDQRARSSLLSAELLARLEAVLQAGRQTILLHNRRGYALNLRCPLCGLVVSCVRCAAHMVYHRADNRIKCHRCGTWAEVPRTCLDRTCGGALRPFGSGIQQLEQELRRLLPAARLLRLDSDAMRKREDYAAALRRFADREADVLLGTQMVAKGLDFPGVALVGVLEADASMWLPDFRAAEQTFQLIVQVVGRAGRREGESLALVQAENAALPAVRAAIEMDYEKFADMELAVRKHLFDPPYSRLARFILSDEAAGRARTEAQRLAERLRLIAGRVDARLRVENPEPCVIPRLREMTRYHVLARTPRGTDFRALIQAACHEKALSPRVKRFVIDVDPAEML